MLALQLEKSVQRNEFKIKKLITSDVSLGQPNLMTAVHKHCEEAGIVRLSVLKSETGYQETINTLDLLIWSWEPYIELPMSSEVKFKIHQANAQSNTEGG